MGGGGWGGGGGGGGGGRNGALVEWTYATRNDRDKNHLTT